MPNSPLVEFDAVGQNFPARDGGAPVEVLKNISFTAEGTETICLLGPSGCGKSTILRLVSGMYDRYIPMPTEGVVKVAGKPVVGPHDDVLTVFQKPILKAWLNVRKNIMLPFKAGLWGKDLSGKDIEERTDRILKAVGLKDYENMLPRQLSGGMQQRVSLAARLVLNPRILCLDEPFSALDPQTRKEMQELVISLWDQYPCLALFVTHDVTEALRVADRIIVLSTRPATIVMDLSIATPKPRTDTWVKSTEAVDLEKQIVAQIRTAASTSSSGTLKMDI